MQHPVSRVHPWHGFIVAMLALAFLAAPAFASPGVPQSHAVAVYQDSDADGIADDLDPDDDNDGVLDVDEAAGQPTPAPGSSDGDGDTIPDILDPDDDNDAVTDDDEAVPPPAPPSNPNQGSGNGQDYDDGGGSVPSDEPAAPLVSALPVTGSGSGLGSEGIAWQVLLVLSAANIAAWSGVRCHRPARISTRNRRIPRRSA